MLKANDIKGKYLDIWKVHQHSRNSIVFHPPLMEKIIKVRLVFLTNLVTQDLNGLPVSRRYLSPCRNSLLNSSDHIIHSWGENSGFERSKVRRCFAYWIPVGTNDPVDVRILLKELPPLDASTTPDLYMFGLAYSSKNGANTSRELHVNFSALKQNQKVEKASPRANHIHALRGNLCA